MEDAGAAIPAGGPDPAGTHVAGRVPWTTLAQLAADVRGTLTVRAYDLDLRVVREAGGPRQADPVREAALIPLLRRALAGEDVVDEVGGQSGGTERVLAAPLVDGGAVVGALVALLGHSGASGGGPRGFRALVERAPVGIWEADATGSVVYANRELLRITGRTLEQSLGHGWRLATHPDDRELVLAHWWECLRTGAPFELETRTVRPGGELRWHRTAAVALRDRSGGVTGYMGVVDDVTDRRAAASEREALGAKTSEIQRREALGALAGGIAHDFNNLLVGVLGNASLLLDEISPDSALRPRLAEIQASAERAAELTRQLLAYAGRTPASVEAVDLTALVQGAAPVLRAAAAPVPLDVDATDEPLIVTGAPEELLRVVTSLVANAAESIEGAAGRVLLGLSGVDVGEALLACCHPGHGASPGRYVALTVADTGPGMSEATLASLFDPFFSTKATGRGLGLAATLGIVSGHGGAVRVESEVGSGTTVTVLLPAAEARAVVARPTGDLRGTVLVVDDEDAVRDVIRETLARAGFDVVTAAGGEDAVTRMRERHDEIAAVVLDMTMPGMDGEATYDALAAITPSLRVLLTSGYADQRAVARIRSEGAARFLAKPFALDDLVSEVTRLVQPAA